MVESEILVGDVFQAIEVDQSFKILEIIPSTATSKKQMVVEIIRNGFPCKGNVDYAQYRPQLLNKQVYRHISNPTLF